MRMDKEIPVRKAIEEALRPSKKKRGKPPMIWLKFIEKDIQSIVKAESRHCRPNHTHSHTSDKG